VQGDRNGDVDQQLVRQTAGGDVEEAREGGCGQGQDDALAALDGVEVRKALGDGPRHRCPDAASGLVGP